MALAKELVGAFPPGQASTIGGQYVTLAAAGTIQGDATAITAGMCLVTAADGNKGVALVGQPGDEVWVFNNAGSTLKVWPPVGAAISVAGTGVGTANAAFSQLTYKATVYKCFTTTQWVAVTSA